METQSCSFTYVFSMLVFVLNGKLSHCDRNTLACKAYNIYYLSLYRKYLLILVYMVLHSPVPTSLISSHSAISTYISSPTGLIPITGLGLMLYCHEKFLCIYSSFYRKCSVLGSLIGGYFLII